MHRDKPKKAVTAEDAEERGGKSEGYALKAYNHLGDSNFNNYSLSLRSSASPAVKMPFLG